MVWIHPKIIIMNIIIAIHHNKYKTKNEFTACIERS
jgi:hypothetical protein